MKLDKVLLENKFSQGSIFCFFPTLYHAVQPIDPKNNIDFNSKMDMRVSFYDNRRFGPV